MDQAEIKLRAFESMRLFAESDSFQMLTKDEQAEVMRNAVALFNDLAGVQESRMDEIESRLTSVSELAGKLAYGGITIGGATQ